jgi:hypothetical protein
MAARLTKLCRSACVFLDDITAVALDLFEREPLPLGRPCAAEASAAFCVAR